MLVEFCLPSRKAALYAPIYVLGCYTITQAQLLTELLFLHSTSYYFNLTLEVMMMMMRI